MTRQQEERLQEGGAARQGNLVRAPFDAESWYRTIADFAYDWVYWEDADGSLGYVSPSCERITGFGIDEFLQDPGLIESIIVPEDRPIWQAHHRHEVQRESQEIQFRIRGKDGRERWIEHACQPVLDRQGGVLGHRASNRDITLRKAAEDELRRHREHLAELVEERTAELARSNKALREEIAERRQVEGALRVAKESAEAARRSERDRRHEAERRHRIAQSLSDVLAVLNSNWSLKEVLDFITVQAGMLLGTRAAAIYSLERETEALTVQATRGLLVTYVAGSDVPVGQNALKRAMELQQPVTVSDLYADHEDEGDLGLGEAGAALVGFWSRVYRALLAVPIIVEGEVYGGMLLYYAEPRTFNEEEVKLAAAFGAQVALAIGNARLRDQIGRTAATAERDRLARDLHDAVTQTLFSASLIAEAMPLVWDQDPEQGRRGLEELRQLTRGASAEMRTLLVELRPAALTEKPLGVLLRHLSDAMMSRSRLPISMEVEGNCTLPADVQIALYRIAQEALNNVVRHAAAERASVSLHCRWDRIKLSIRDDGVGFDKEGVLPDRLGLSTMRERARDIGADLTVESSPGQGTSIDVIWVPVRGFSTDG